MISQIYINQFWVMIRIICIFVVVYQKYLLEGFVVYTIIEVVFKMGISCYQHAPDIQLLEFLDRLNVFQIQSFFQNSFVCIIVRINEAFTIFCCSRTRKLWETINHLKLSMEKYGTKQICNKRSKSIEIDTQRIYRTSNYIYQVRESIFIFSRNDKTEHQLTIIVNGIMKTSEKIYSKHGCYAMLPPTIYIMSNCSEFAIYDKTCNISVS